MIKFYTFLICICLSVIILLQTPRKNVGISNSVTGWSINFITIFGILIYLGLAIKLNLSVNT
jgi:hypothetical protein